MTQTALKLIYPNQPGFKKRGTSSRAAREMANKAPTLRDRCLEVLQHYEFTPDEVAHALQVSILAIRPRISELSKMGLIEETGGYRENDSGKIATVYRAKL